VHYVNSCGNNGKSSFILLVANGATPQSAGGYSPYYLLHGREMVLPALQDLRAKVSPEMRGTEQETLLENLKSNLRKACKLDSKNNRKSHRVNKRCNERRSKIRKFEVCIILTNLEQTAREILLRELSNIQ
jgi:hypothetical protein